MDKRFGEKFHELIKVYNKKYLLLISSVMIYSLSKLFFDLVKFDISESKIFTLMCFIIIGIYILKPIKNIVLNLVLYLEITIIGIIWMHYFNILQFANSSIFNKLYIRNYVDFINSSYEYIIKMKSVVKYQSEFPVFFILLIVVIIFLITLNNKSPIYLFFIGYSFIHGWFSYIDSSIILPIIYLLGLVLYIVEYMHIKNKSSRMKYYKYKSLNGVYLVIIIIVFLITEICISLFPIDRINNKISAFVPDINGIRSQYPKQVSYGYFSLDKTIYQPEERLGGSISEFDNELLMLIETQSNNLYIRGRVKNKYDGSKWINENINYLSESDNQNDLMMNLNKMIIYPKNMKTITIFSPYHFINSSFDSKYIYSNKDNIVFYKGPKSYDLENEYTIYFNDNSYEQLNEKELKRYLEVPKSGLDYTRSVVNNLIMDSEDDYKKMKAIENYLRSNDQFKYSLIVNDNEKASDFVEDFIKYEKRGYCTYFASALAIMGRMANVPTRYIEGFILPEEVNSDGFYEVTVDKAHAWVEAYISGIGWVTFESTPIYRNINIEEDKTEIIKKRLLILDKQKTLEIANDKINKEDLLEDNHYAESVNSKIKYVVILIVIIMVILNIGYKFILEYRKRVFNKLIFNEKVIYKLVYIFKYLKKIGYESNGNLQIEFLDDILYKFGISVSEEEKNIIYKSLYGNILLTDKEYKIFDDLYNSFIEILRVNKKIM